MKFGSRLITWPKLTFDKYDDKQNNEEDSKNVETGLPHPK